MMIEDKLFRKSQQTFHGAISEGDTAFNKTGSWRYLNPVSEEKLAPCRNACPAGTDIPRVLRLVAEGRLDEAYQLIVEENPFPAICGRVCYHPCEFACHRRLFDEAANIQAVERFIADSCEDRAAVPYSDRQSQEAIAIVGSGPAGLSCAWFLAREGFRVTVFESEREAGGMLRLGIPRYRLPRPVLDRQIERLSRMGVVFRLGCRVGADVSISDLHRLFNAVFVATGAHWSRSSGVPVENGARVMAGLDFLKKVNAGTPPDVGQKVLVIGGGNTAIDAARAALRIGAKVVIAYRRSRAEMPASGEEVEEAENEGVTFLFKAAPKRIRVRDGAIDVALVETRLGETGESGRRRPIEIAGSDFMMRFDTVLEAIGEQPDFRVFGQSSEPNRHASGRESLLEKGVILGGDASTGPSTVVEAIASGKAAARQILLRLNSAAEGSAARPVRQAAYEDLNLNHFSRSARARLRQAPPALRVRDFREVVEPLTLEAAQLQARRCFSCGVCNECDNCWVFCPEGAVIRVNGEYRPNLDFCKGCGLCAHECPRGVITLQQEAQ